MRVGVFATALVVVLAGCTGEAGDSTTDASADQVTTSSETAGSGDDPPPTPMTCWQSRTEGSESEGISFSDVTAEYGLVDPLTGMHPHAAVFGDFDSDGWPDLVVGTFADRDPDVYAVRGATGPKPDVLMQLREGSFDPVEGLPEVFSRSSGGVAADLDGDGDADLILVRNITQRQPGLTPTQILRNDDGTFVVEEAVEVPGTFGGRSAAVFDYDLDGLLDVYIAEDRWTGADGVLLKNTGSFRFINATTSAGLPNGVHGLGVVVSDFDGDGRQDLFVSGSNRLFMSEGDASFREVDNSVFVWEAIGSEDDVAGAAAADVNNDGLIDLLLGHHYNSTLDRGSEIPVRLYLNRGSGEDGDPVFEDVTEAAGLAGLPTKAPHVELVDFDNDGLIDIHTTASAQDGSQHAVFRGVGFEGDVPTFEAPGGLGSGQYWVSGPTVDINRDGLVDVFLVEWEPTLPSLLLLNRSGSGHWLEVSVGPEHLGGIGWRVEVYEAGDVGSTEHLLGTREIAASQGYSAGLMPLAHFGLGSAENVDVRLIPPGGEPVDLDSVSADQHIRYPGGCG